MKRRMGRGWAVILSAELLLLIVLFAGSFREEQLTASFQGAELLAETSAEGEGSLWKSKNMKLMPGVYQICVWENMAQGQECRIQVESRGASFQSLRGNSVEICREQEYIDFEIYVTAKVTDAYVSCICFGGSAEMLEKVEIYRLHWGSRMGFFVLLMVFVVLDSFLVWRRRILDGKADGTEQFVVWSLAGAAALAYFPFLTDYFFINGDTAAYLEHIETMKETLSEGHMPVLYGEIFLWLPVFFRLAGFSAMTSYKLFVLTAVGLMGAISYISFKRCTGERKGALLGAFLYTLNPWGIHLLYREGEICIYLAMVFMPLVCSGILGIFREEEGTGEYGRNKWFLAAGVTAALYGYLPCAVLIAGGVLLSAVFFYRRLSVRSVQSQLIQAGGIVAAMNCWCLLPALFALPGIKNIQKGFVGYPVWEWKASVLLWMAVSILIPLWACVMYGRWAGKKRPEAGGGILFIIVAAVVGIAMYEVNDIAFTSPAVRLYTAESMFSVQALPEASSVFYIAQGLSLAITLVFLFMAPKRGKGCLPLPVSQPYNTLCAKDTVKPGKKVLLGGYGLIAAIVMAPVLAEGNAFAGGTEAWSGNAAGLWRLVMILIQVGTLITSHVMFRRLFRETGQAVFFGVLFYCSSPYRLYVCYGLGDMYQAVVWVLLPLYVWAVAGIVRNHKNGINLAVAAVVLGGIGYGDVPQMLIVMGITVMAAIWFRKPALLAVLALGGVTAIPELLHLGKYLFGESVDILGIPPDSIMSLGYEPGEFFRIFVYREGHPGMGGILLALAVGLWLWFVKGQKGWANGFCLLAAGVLLLCSLKYFPWELAQRPGIWALKLIALFRTPAVFYGYGQIFMCILAAAAMGEAGRQKEKMIASGVPLTVLALCLGICVYQYGILSR